MASGPGEKAPAPRAELRLWKRFSAEAAPWIRALHSEGLEPAEPEPCGKRKQGVVVLRYSPPVESEGPHQCFDTAGEEEEEGLRRTGWI